MKHLIRGISNEQICEDNAGFSGDYRSFGDVHRMKENERLVIPDPWECIQCGMCCKRYDPDTDSIISCQHLQEDNSCGIYETRPIACRMDWHGPNQAKIDHCNLAIMSIQTKMTVFDLIQLSGAIGRGEVTLDG